MKWFYWLTGGRPMKFLEHGFIDIVVHKAVNYYECRLTGSTYMAHHSCSLFRVEVLKDVKQ